MKQMLAKYHCDAKNCAGSVTVDDGDQMQPDGWMIIDAWVVGAGGGKQHICPSCKPKFLKGIER